MTWGHSVRTRNAVSVVAVRGHLDQASEDALHRTLIAEILRDDVAVVQLDLRAVTFLGASAAAVLVAASFAGRAAGRRVLLGECSDQAGEMLRRTGATEVGLAAARRPAAKQATSRLAPRRKKELASA